MESPDGPDERRCHSCGEWLQPGDRYCPSCGTRVDQSESGHEAGEQPVAGPAEPSPGPETEPPAGERGPGKPGSMVDRESPLLTVGIGVILAVLGILVPVAVLLPVALITRSLSVPPIVSGPLILLLQFSLFVAFGFGYLRWRGYNWPGVRSYLGVERPSLRDIGLILVTWVGMAIVIIIVSNIVIWALPEILGTEQTEPAGNPISETIEQNPEIVFLAIAFMFLVVGPAEEILFRGVVQNRLREGLSKIPAILLASALFASVHVLALAGQDPVAIAQTIIILFVPSLGLGFIYEYTENIVVPALLHGFHNSMLVLITAIGAVYGPQEAVLLPPVVADILAAA